MYTNKSIIKTYQLILEQFYNMERKLDELMKDKAAGKIAALEDELLTVPHATAYLRISPSTLYQLTCRSPFYEKRQWAVFQKGRTAAVDRGGKQQAFYQAGKAGGGAETLAPGEKEKVEVGDSNPDCFS